VPCYFSFWRILLPHLATSARDVLEHDPDRLNQIALYISLFERGFRANAPHLPCPRERLFAFVALRTGSPFADLGSSPQAIFRHSPLLGFKLEFGV